jgi:hypothetical protein
MHEMEENLSVVYTFICVTAVLLVVYLGAVLLIWRETLWESVRTFLLPSLPVQPDEAGKSTPVPGNPIQGTRASH